MSQQPPWTAVPAARSTLPILQLRLGIVAGLISLAALAGIISAIAWFTLDIPAVNLDDAKPQAAAEAMRVALDFTAGTPTPVPVATELSATLGFDSRQPAALSQSVVIPQSWKVVTVGQRSAELHSFRVFNGDMSLDMTVVMLLTPEGPVLGAYPSIAPTSKDPTVLPMPFDYRDLGTALEAIPKPVIDRVEAWAQAYAADNQAALGTLTDDPSAQLGDYRGLGGYAVDAATVLAVVPAVSETDVRYVIRVRVSFRSLRGDGGVTSDYDLLVAAAETSTPKVVAWGPPGSGPTLSQYINRAS